jgi:hypothetical protein
MTISSIQRTKFLETIYKNYFSAGYKPTEKEVLDLYSKYFFTYTPGSPIPLSPEIFRSTTFSNVDLINQKMANALLNIENLYDVIFENSDDLFDTTNALNKRLEELKNRRTQLEAKVDDFIFSNQNSDGYFASVTETFSNGNGIDYNLSSVFLDVVNKNVSIPKLNSAIFDLVSSNSIISNDPKYTLSFNRQIIDSNKSFSNESFFGSVFDGLTNTEWSQTFDFDSVGVVTLTINIPITQSANISKIEGRLNVVSPVDIYVKVNYSNGSNPEIKSKKSTYDYDTFSFSFTPGDVSSIDLILVKTEPDYTELSSNKKFKYRFGIRDINISGQYYDSFGSLISNPISLNTKDNGNLIIDSVAVDVEETNTANGSISYFIAEDKGTEQSILDFSWTPISKPYDSSSAFSSFVNLNGSTVNTLQVVDTVTDSSKQISKIPEQTASAIININAENPTQRVYSGVPVYRLAQMPKYDNPYNSYILEGINMVQGSYVTRINDIANESNGLTTWTSLINRTDNTRQLYSLAPYEMGRDSISFSGPNLSNVSMLLNFNIFCANDIIVKQRFVKNDEVSQKWNIGLYINNNVYIIPSNQKYETIEWRLQKGVNTIRIAIDSSDSAYGSISLMDQESIMRYGIIYSQYYSYVDPLELRYNRSQMDNVFTIDSVFGNKEILSKKNIKSNSRIFYFSNNPNPIKKIRFRADLSRGISPLMTPVLNSYKIKFKNSQSFSDISNSLIADNSATE